MIVDFPTRIAPEIHLDSIDSTNRELARRLGLGQARPGCALLSREQTAGRGSRGRHWWSQPGDCLTVSIALPAFDPPVAVTMLGAVAAQACARQLGASAARIKWPNDVLLEGRKLAGVLAEGATRSGAAVVVLGIGLNVRVDSARLPEELRGRVAGLDAADRPVEPEAAWSCLRHELEQRMERIARGGVAELIDEFARGLELTGQEVQLVAAGRSHRGRFRGVDAAGRLRLQTAGGGHRDFAAAHIESMSAGEPEGPPEPEVEGAS